VGHHHLPAEAVTRFARIDIESELPAAVAVRERRTVRSATRSDTIERYPVVADAARTSEGFVATPLQVGDESFGVLVFGFDDGIEPLEQTFLETVAGQLAHAISRIRLTAAYQERARNASEAAARERHRRGQLEFLAELTQTAIRATDHRQLMRTVTAAAVPTLGDWCSIRFIPQDGSGAEVVVSHTDPARVAWAEELYARHEFDPNAPTGVAAVIRTGRTEVIREITSEIIEGSIEGSVIPEAELRGIFDALRPTSAITVPLLARRGVIGAMQFVTAESGRRYDDSDVALAEAIAGRVAETLTGHWLTDQHRQISETLQRSLLPPVLATIPGFDIAARYWPASAVSEVGGDFYDVFSIGRDQWALLIGDACGTGTNAAALTAIARHTVRAAARHDVDHTEVIDWLNQSVLLSDRNLFCTACYATLQWRADDRRWQLRTTSAGHPLPVLRPVGRRSRSLGAPGTLLGMFEEVDNQTATASLRTGDVVVLYTDGVTDLPPPGGLTHDGVNRLVDAMPDDLTAAEIADAIQRDVMERVSDTQRHDDIALLVLRVVGDLER
jgi:serine phosphatase RsbU (regulator of sigma subunit)